MQNYEAVIVSVTGIDNVQKSGATLKMYDMNKKGTVFHVTALLMNRDN